MASFGLTDNKLRPCPSSPNCVTSESKEGQHKIEPFRLRVQAGDVWPAISTALNELPRTTLVTITETYLHAESRSRLFGFVDDLELHLRPADGIIAIRSAARSGYYDFGVNRKRIEQLRERLVGLGLVEPFLPGYAD